MGAKQSLLPEVAQQCQLSPEEVKKLLAGFRKHSKKGSIDRAGFTQVFSTIDYRTRGDVTMLSKHETCGVLFDTLDVSHDGSLDVEELMLGLSVLSRGSMEQKAELMFKSMDTNDSGALDKEEIKKQFEKLLKVVMVAMKAKINSWVYQKFQEVMPPEDLNALMESGFMQPVKKVLTVDGPEFILKHGDTNNDGVLSQEEWMKLVKEKEMAQWLVDPDLYVKKIQAEVEPKIAALMAAM